MKDIFTIRRLDEANQNDFVWARCSSESGMISSNDGNTLLVRLDGRDWCIGDKIEVTLKRKDS